MFNKKTREVLFKMLRLSCIPYLMRETLQKRYVTIITFHDPEAASFNLAVRYFIEHYNIISLSQFTEFLDGKCSVPEKSLLITLDDGHKNNYKLLDTVKTYNLPITIFLCSDIVGTNRHYWWKYPSNGYKQKQLKKMSEEMRTDILRKSGYTYKTEYCEDERQALGIEEIRGMTDAGKIEFQSHTMFHVLLNTCSNTIAYKEINQSKSKLENLLNKKVYALAFPNGLYNDESIRYANEAGYKCALTMDPGFNNKNTNPFKLKRLGIGDDAKIDEIIVRSSGIWGFFKKIKISLFPWVID